MAGEVDDGRVGRGFEVELSADEDELRARGERFVVRYERREQRRDRSARAAGRAPRRARPRASREPSASSSSSGCESTRSSVSWPAKPEAPRIATETICVLCRKIASMRASCPHCGRARLPLPVRPRRKRTWSPTGRSWPIFQRSAWITVAATTKPPAVGPSGAEDHGQVAVDVHRADGVAVVEDVRRVAAGDPARSAAPTRTCATPGGCPSGSSSRSTGQEREKSVSMSRLGEEVRRRLRAAHRADLPVARVLRPARAKRSGGSPRAGSPSGSRSPATQRAARRGRRARPSCTSPASRAARRHVDPAGDGDVEPEAGAAARARPRAPTAGIRWLSHIGTCVAVERSTGASAPQTATVASASKRIAKLPSVTSRPRPPPGCRRAGSPPGSAKWSIGPAGKNPCASMPRRPG